MKTLGSCHVFIFSFNIGDHRIAIFLCVTEQISLSSGVFAFFIQRNQGNVFTKTFHINGKDTAIEVRLFPWEELDMKDTLRAKLFPQQGK